VGHDAASVEGSPPLRRFAVEARAEQGRERARYLLENHLQRRSGADHPELEAF
jgi:hypothetical protein